MKKKMKTEKSDKDNKGASTKIRDKSAGRMADGKKAKKTK